MAKKTHRVSIIAGDARSNKYGRERKGVNCTEDEVQDYREKFREEIREKAATNPEKYGSDWVESDRRDDID